MPTASSSAAAPSTAAQRALLLRLAWRERGVVRDLGRLTLATARHPLPLAERGRPVLICPGYLTSDHATALFRRRLCKLGHDARGWGQGTNTGRLDTLVPRAAQALLALQAAHAGQPVVLVGWSLGGVVTRILARQHPGAVAHVVTLGTPLQGLQGTTFAPLYSPEQIAASHRIAQERERVPVPVPLTVAYTRADNVVHWESSLDHHNAHAHHVEVDCTHTGLVFSPDPLRVVAAVLAS